MATKKRWTSWEDTFIKKEIKKHPNNLQECFRLCSIKLERTPEAIAKRWYKVISKTNPCFIIFSTKTGLRNRKNSKSNHKVNFTTKLWNTIINIFK